VNPRRWQQIKAALNAALEMTPERRSAYIDEISAKDSELRGELLSLLAAHDQAGDAFLNTPAAGIEQFDKLKGPDPWVGKHIGPYQLIEVIGSGGMGEVYRAVRADDEYQKQVAIKLIRAGQDSAFVVQRFRNERQILANLDQPNIARLLDGGTTGEGLPYFVMEFIQGEPIDRYCDRHQFDTTARLRLFLQVCGAVQYAHQRLIIHRDLKPNNILVSDEGVPKLLDFGIAKILGPHERLSTDNETRSVFRMLTPEYASPEQVRGEPITTASDVYSLGLVLYELLTGRRPHEIGRSASPGAAPTLQDREPRKPSAMVRRRDTKSKTGDAAGPEALSAVRDGTPQRLSRRLRGDLDNIVLMALRSEPARRYESVEQFAEDLRRHLSSHPVIARTDTLRYRGAKFIARYAVGVAAAVILAVALLAGLLVTMREARIAQIERARAEHRFDDVRKLAHSLIFDINDSIQNLSGSSEARHLILKTGLQYLDSLSREASGDPSLQRELAAAYERLGDVQGRALEVNEGDYAGAAASYRHALDLRQSIVTAQPLNMDVRRELIVSYGKLSDLMWSSGKPAEAMMYSQDTVSDSRFLVAIDPKNRKYQMLLASSLLDNGFKRFKIQGDTVRALQSVRQSIGSLQSLWAADNADLHVGRTLSLAYSRAADILSHDPDRYAEALAMDENARMLIKSLAQRAPGNADLAHLAAFSDHDVGDVLIKMSEFDRAEPDELAALEEFRRLSAADPKIAEYHLDIALSLASMAAIAVHRAQPALALSQLQEALQTYAADVGGEASNDYFRSAKAAEQRSLADIYVGLASNKKLSGAARIPYWRSAKAWYEKSLDTLGTPQASETGSRESAEAVAEVRQKIRACNVELAALAP
jgi:serine/threonine protein kinase